MPTADTSPDATRAVTRLDLHVWSGTGNSYRVAEWLRAHAESRGLAATIDRMERLMRPLAADDDAGGRLVGVLTPTHGFTAPWHTIRHVCRLPHGHGSGAFVLATRAGTKLWGLHLPGMEGTTLFLLALLLALRGYRVRGTLGLDMPSNWIAFHPGFRPRATESIIGRAKPRAERFLARLLEGRRAWSGWICLLLGLALVPVSTGYLVYGRFYLAKLFFANRRCNGCGLCAESCSVRGIRMSGDPARPYWTFWCESCMRCMAFCPQRAVEASHSWAVLMYYGASALPAWLLAQYGERTPWLAWAGTPGLRFAVTYVYFLGAVSLAYLVLATLARRPALNTLFTWTTLTSLYRRYHEPSTSIRDVAGPRPTRPETERNEENHAESRHEASDDR